VAQGKLPQTRGTMRGFRGRARYLSERRLFSPIEERFEREVNSIPVRQGASVIRKDERGEQRASCWVDETGCGLTGSIKLWSQRPLLESRRATQKFADQRNASGAGEGKIKTEYPAKLREDERLVGARADGSLRFPEVKGKTKGLSRRRGGFLKPEDPRGRRFQASSWWAVALYISWGRKERLF